MQLFIKNDGGQAILHLKYTSMKLYVCVVKEIPLVQGIIELFQISKDSFYYSRKKLKSVVWMLNNHVPWVNGWSMLKGVVLDFKEGACYEESRKQLCLLLKKQRGG